MGVDCAPEYYYYKNNRYAIKDQAAALETKEYIKFMIEAVNKYNMLIVEDPLHRRRF